MVLCFSISEGALTIGEVGATARHGESRNSQLRVNVKEVFLILLTFPKKLVFKCCATVNIAWKQLVIILAAARPEIFGGVSKYSYAK